jgi:hypothetical protein
MKTKVSIVLVSFVVCLCGFTTLAQAQEQKAQLYVIWDVVVKPSTVGDYEAATKEEVALYAKYKFPYTWTVSRTFDNHYYFLIPVENFAGIDDIFTAFDKVEEMAGEEYKKLQDLFVGSYEYVQPAVYSLNYELSFLPEKKEAESEEGNFICWDIQYINAGKEEEYEKLIKEFQHLFQSKNVSQAWECYQGIMGEKNPVYYWVTTAKNAVDFYTQNAKMWEALGKEGDSFYEKLMNLIRKREMKTGWLRPDLSYMPKEK